MNTRRMNITIPKADADRLKSVHNKSAFIAGAVREKLDAEQKLKRDAELAQAYRAASAEDKAQSDEWDRLAGDAL